MTPSPTQSQIDAALRALIINIVPGIEVVRGQDNRVGEPQGVDHVVFWVTNRIRLETNIDGYDFLLNQTFTQNYEVDYQLDVHGPNSSDNAVVISTLLRDDYAFQFLTGQNPNVFPLLADDPRQVPFINAENQFEYRWIVDARLQVNQTVSAPVSFATLPGPITVIDVDEAYPPH